MRIDLFGSAATTETVAQSNKTNTNATSTTNHLNGSASTEDTTSLSSGSESVQSLTKTALQPIPSRAAKVESLKQAVNNAQYQLDAVQIADALSSSDV